MKNGEQELAKKIADNILSEQPIFHGCDDTHLKNEYLKLLAENLSTEGFIDDKRQELNSFNKKEGWKRFTQKIESKRKRSIAKRGITIAAAIVLFSFAVYNINQNYLTDVVEDREQVVSILKSIESGATKASLITSSGEEISLNKDNREISVDNVLFNVDSSSVLKVENSNSNTQEYYTLRTQNGGEYTSQLCDGTRVWLSAASEISFPASFANDKRVVYVKGEAYFDVKKDKRPFVVISENIEIEVLGTQFSVYDFKGESTKVALAEGSVSLYNNKMATKETLTPGKQLRIDGNTGIYKIEDVDIEAIRAWKNGLIYFDNETIENIIKKLERWYSVDIEIADEDIKKRVIYGVIKKYSDISQMIEMMKHINLIDFKISGNKIIISKYKK